MKIKNKEVLNLLTGMECNFLYNNTDYWANESSYKEYDIDKLFDSAIKRKKNLITENKHAIKGFERDIVDLNTIRNKLLKLKGAENGK